MVNYKTIRKFSEESGYSMSAINAKIDAKVWPKDRVWFKAPDGRRLISVEGYNQWVEGVVSRSQHQQASKLSSSIKGSDAGSGLSLTLQPLVFL